MGLSFTHAKVQDISKSRAGTRCMCVNRWSYDVKTRKRGELPKGRKTVVWELHQIQPGYESLYCGPFRQFAGWETW